MTVLGPTQRVLLLLDLGDIVAERVDSITVCMDLVMHFIYLINLYAKLYLIMDTSIKYTY